MAILLCDGDSSEKATELYNLVQPHSEQVEIAFTDKDLKDAFLFFVNFATIFTIFTESTLTKNERPPELSSTKMTEY